VHEYKGLKRKSITDIYINYSRIYINMNLRIGETNVSLQIEYIIFFAKSILCFIEKLYILFAEFLPHFFFIIVMYVLDDAKYTTALR